VGMENNMKNFEEEEEEEKEEKEKRRRRRRIYHLPGESQKIN
jgi:hypothetical protein